MEVIEYVELHDSLVKSVTADAVLVLDAYVHHWERQRDEWVGVGRTQVARLSIAAGRSVLERPLEDTWIMDGWLRLGGVLHENLLPVPLGASGGVAVRLELRDGNTIDLEGESVLLELLGPFRHVEDLPPEWAPDDMPSNPALHPTAQSRRG